MATRRVRLVAEISGGFTGEAGPDFKDGELPPSYEKAMEPYARKGDKAGATICKNLSALLKASLIPENFSAWAQVLSSSRELESSEVQVTGFSFDGTTNLPEIDAIAVFQVDVVSDLDESGLNELEDQAGESAGEMINFYWSFEDNPHANWDGSLVNHSGIEITIE